MYAEFDWNNAIKKRRRYSPQMYFDLVSFIEEQFESNPCLISDTDKLAEIIYKNKKFTLWPSKFIKRVINDFMSHDDKHMNDDTHDTDSFFFQFEYLDDDDEEYSYHGSSRHLHDNKQFSCCLLHKL